MKKKTKLLLNLALTLFFLIMIIVKGPNLNPLYSDGAFAWCFIFSSYVVLNFLIGLGGSVLPHVRQRGQERQGN